jgi:ketosteroid isomerase-like protein
MTVWRKQADGRWRFALDLGISNPEPKSQLAMLFSGPAGTSFRRIKTEAARAALLQVERAFSAASAKRGAVEAFLAYAASDVRLFRNDKYPFVGRKSAVMGLTPLSTESTWIPEFTDVSASGDLGYSYGTYELRDKTSRTISETGNFAHVWKKVGRVWKLVIDVADPVPPEKKN